MCYKATFFESRVAPASADICKTTELLATPVVYLCDLK